MRVCEVGARDGLQNEKWVGTEAKKLLCSRLLGAGVSYLEATAFVSPTKVPQMRDSIEVFSAIEKGNATIAAIVPNWRGLESFKAAGGGSEIAVLAACSDAFSMANMGASRSTVLENLERFVKECRSENLKVRAYLSTAVACPYSGWIDPGFAAEQTARLIEMGCYQVSLGDTIGKATPHHIDQLVRKCAEAVGIDQLAIHAHDTYGQGVANVSKAVELGVTTVDSAVGGLGGCPYAPGATGNVATEDVVYLLHGSGYNTGIDLEKLCETSKWICETLNRPLSRVAQALTS